MASVTSGIPGPSSRATRAMPWRLPCWMGARIISPDLAWSTMLRATSEMAVAIKVKSDPPKPNCIPSWRPFWRAVTMSDAQLMATRVSFCMTHAPASHPAQVGQPFLEVQSSAHPFQGQSQLHHGKGHVGLDANNHRFGSAQFEHMGNGAQSACGKRIDDVQDRD